jgi:hypothetical protein
MSALTRSIPGPPPMAALAAGAAARDDKALPCRVMTGMAH